MNKFTFLSVLFSTFLIAPVFAGGNPEAGKEKSAVCAGCHGADGNSAIGANPRLAGQYESYLFYALNQYKTGERKDLLMGNMVANLSKQDMKDLAAWFARQDGDNLRVLRGE